MERIAAGECRAEEGRKILGVALPYGERSASHRERFEPGAFGPWDSSRVRWLNVRHDPYAVIAHTAEGGGLRLIDSDAELRIDATVPAIPAGDVALEGLRSGALGGLSIEFKATNETREGDTRIIKRALLYGVGVVPRPSYLGATAEVRAEIRAAGVRATVSYRSRLACECHQGKDCNTVQFEPGAFEESLAEVNAGQRDILAIVGSYRWAVASAKNGSMALRSGPDGLEVEIARLPDTTAARDLQELSTAVPILARPVFRAQPGDYEEIDTPEGRVAIYKKAELRAILLGATDRDKGWTPAEFPEPSDTPAVRSRSSDARRALWL